jgi:hypothetical protein
VPSRKTPLQVRQEAALKLLARGELDPYEALSLVCWPRKGSRLEDEQVPLGKQLYSNDVHEEIRRRHAAGESIPELAFKTGIPFGQVKFMVSGEGAKREPAELTLF